MVDIYRVVGVEMIGRYYFNRFVYLVEVDFVWDVVWMSGVCFGFEGVEFSYGSDVGIEDCLNKYSWGCWWKFIVYKCRNVMEDIIIVCFKYK